MPRIAASLGVVVIVAACLGFNTMRYPVVWEMVAVSHQLPQVGQASKPAEAQSVKPPSTDVKAATAATTGQPRYICTGDVCRIARPQEMLAAAAPEHPASSATAPSPPVCQPPATEETAAPAPVAQDDPPRRPLPVEPQPPIGRLVPVARPEASSQAAEPSRVPRTKAATTSQQLASAVGVRPLPPLDCIGTPASDARDGLTGDQVPIYPSTTNKRSWH